MTLIDRIKTILRDKDMSFTDLAAKMGSPRSSLYKSIQTESIKFSTLKKIAEALGLEVYNLVTVLDVQKIEDLEGEIFVMLHEMNNISRQLVRLKHGRIDMKDVQEDFDAFARSTQWKWPQRLMTMEEIEEYYKLKEPDSSSE
jgi:DNA-binding Xre family transcriptional regulator